MEKKDLFKGYICVALSAIIFGLMPLMARSVYGEGVDPKSLVLLRNIISVPCFYLLTLYMGDPITIKVSAIPQIALIALTGCCMTPFLLFCSYNYLPSGTATVLHFIYPAAVVVGEYIFLKNKVSTGHIISVIMCVLGIGFFYDPHGGISLKGSILALMSGVAYATYVILVSGFKYRKEMSGIKFSFYVAVFSTVIMLIVCLFSGSIALPGTLYGWLLTIAFALSVNVAAVALFHKGTFLIGGGRSAVISTFEPVTSILAGIVIFSEKVTVFNITGSVMIIAASILIAVCDIKALEKKGI